MSHIHGKSHEWLTWKNKTPIVGLHWCTFLWQFFLTAFWTWRDFVFCSAVNCKLTSAWRQFTTEKTLDNNAWHCFRQTETFDDLLIHHQQGDASKLHETLLFFPSQGFSTHHPPRHTTVSHACHLFWQPTQKDTEESPSVTMQVSQVIPDKRAMLYCWCAHTLLRAHSEETSGGGGSLCDLKGDDHCRKQPYIARSGQLTRKQLVLYFISSFWDITVQQLQFQQQCHLICMLTCCQAWL